MRVTLLNIIKALLTLRFGDKGDRCNVCMDLTIDLFLFLYVLSQLRVFIQAMGGVTSCVGLSTKRVDVLLGVTNMACITRFTSKVYGSTKCRGVTMRVRVFAGLAVLTVKVPMLLSLLRLVKSFLV